MAIYLDHASTTMQKPEVLKEAMTKILDGQYGNPSRGAHPFALDGFRIVESARTQVKQLFKATNRYEVAFTNNATVALNEVLKGLLMPNDHVITTDWEHNAVLRPLYQLEEDGVVVDIVRSKETTGQLQYDDFLKLLRKDTKMVVCNHASNVTGNVLDLAFIKKFCVKHKLLLIVDVSQTAGVIDIDLSDECIAAVCFTGHKSLYGPQGTGGVCIRNDVKIAPVLTGGDGTHTFSKQQPSHLPSMLEVGTLNLPGIAGLEASIAWLMKQEKKESYGLYFYESISNIRGITIYGDFTRPRVDVFSINFLDADSAVASDVLFEDYDIATRSGYHCAPLMHEALGTKKTGTVRFSFSMFTTKEEIDDTIKAIKQLSKS